MNAPPAESALQDDARTLRGFLDHQRSAVLAIVDGLDEQAWHRPIVPSGWTPGGLLAHLGGAERHWFQDVVLGLDDVLPWDDGQPDYDPHMALTCERPPAEIMAYYREQCARSNAVLDVTALTAAPARQAQRPRRGRPAIDRALGRAAHDRGDRVPLRPPRHRPRNGRRQDEPRRALETVAAATSTYARDTGNS